MAKKYRVLLLGFVVLVVAVPLLLRPFVHDKLEEITVHVPEYQRPPDLVRLDQNWTPEQRKRFHHTPQGTRLIRYDWFKALEQPCLSPFGCGMFSDSAYLDRFGFIPSETDPDLNPDGLPVGFAIDREFVDPISKAAYTVVGLNCAACHTNELYYGNHAVQIEGAPATIEVAAFQKALGLALAFNSKFPFNVGRYSRFEERVLGANASDAQKKELKDSYDAFLTAALAEKKVVDEGHIYDNGAGFRRTDALARIGNQVFGADTRIAANYTVSTAPVRFPANLGCVVAQLGAIQLLDRRSVGPQHRRSTGRPCGREALWFRGRRVRKLGERQRASDPGRIAGGSGPLKGLASPRWPSVFPALDKGKVARGAALYQERCQACHLPPLPELLTDLEAAYRPGPEPKYWWKNALGNWFIRVRDIGIEEIGTDPHEATDFNGRTADTGDLKKGVVSAREGLDLVTRGIASKFFETNKIPPEEHAAWAGGRDPRDVAVRDDLIYKARPLNGIWAVAPFLHNGSVPNLYLLLSPQSERPDTFWVGSKQFDPVKVGYDPAEFSGATQFDISRPGNSNAGHEFKDGPVGKGVIGPLLSPDDRMAIIEYLKSL